MLYPYPHPGMLQSDEYRVFTLRKGRVRVWGVASVPRVLWHRRTNLTEVSGRGTTNIQNSPKFGHVHECRPELKEVIYRVIPG